MWHKYLPNIVCISAVQMLVPLFLFTHFMNSIIVFFFLFSNIRVFYIRHFVFSGSFIDVKNVSSNVLIDWIDIRKRIVCAYQSRHYKQFRLIHVQNFTSALRIVGFVLLNTYKFVFLFRETFAFFFSFWSQTDVVNESILLMRLVLIDSNWLREYGIRSLSCHMQTLWLAIDEWH